MDNLSAALAAAAPGADQSKWLAPLDAAMTEGGVTTNRRIAAFLGQVAVEAGASFSEIAENLYYTHPIRLMAVFGAHFPTIASAVPYVGNPEKLANFVYANRMGNRDPGDGWAFRGGGLLQLTGRDEYAAFGASRGMSAELAAALVRTPQGAADSAVWYWTTHDLSDLADAWEITAITRAINGPAMEGAAERIAASNAALAAIGDTT